MAQARTLNPELVAVLKRLKLGRIAETLPERLVLADKSDTPLDEFLLLILIDEIARRDSTAAQVRAPDAWAGPGHHIEPLAVANEMCPTLAFFGTNDTWTPADDIAALRDAWSGRNDCEIVLVEGAEHGFVHDPDRPVHRADDAAMAWTKTIAWLNP